jgi:hypothetical protein
VPEFGMWGIQMELTTGNLELVIDIGTNYSIHPTNMHQVQFELAETRANQATVVVKLIVQNTMNVVMIKSSQTR